MIAAGTSVGDLGARNITLWTRNTPQKNPAPRRTAMSVVRGIVQVVMAIATIVLILQSIMRFVSKTSHSKSSRYSLVVRMLRRNGWKRN
jgi:hypothetical protein